MTRGSRIIAAALVATVVAGCGIGVTPSPTRTALTVGLGYIPSVQFAPFYLADEAGYYRDAGLDVTFQNKIETDLVRLVGAGTIDIGVADGTDVVPAVSQGIPVRYLATLYRSFPSIVFTPTDSGIATPADLRGRKVGIPGRYGSSWVMLQALLGSAGLTPDDVQVVEYPDYGQAAAVQQGAVDAATGFVNNEPIQLGLEGIPTTILAVDAIVPLPGPGLIAGTSTLTTKEAAIRAFIGATIRAMTEIAADPAKGLDAAERVVPELAADRSKQAAILDATIQAWRGASGAGSLGAIDKAGWDSTITFLTRLGLVPNAVKVDDLVRADLLPG
ncbi:MAG: ABC transporter substrate-binding protein [Candidatus Limnocylindrales bacterium]